MTVFRGGARPRSGAAVPRDLVKAGSDHSIPDRDNHDRHLMHIARATGARGFPVLALAPAPIHRLPSRTGT